MDVWVGGWVGDSGVSVWATGRLEWDGVGEMDGWIDVLMDEWMDGWRGGWNV